MPSRYSVRDPSLLDHLGDVPQIQIEIELWRVTREGRDPLQSSSPKGRWDDGTFEVLYTAREANGAMAEIYFHYSKGQPIFPTQMRFKLYRIRVRLGALIDLSNSQLLGQLGVDLEKYGALAFNRKNDEYRRSQSIGEAAHFLAADGIIVPNARWDCNNAILFMSKIAPADIAVVEDRGIVDFVAWSNENLQTRH